jgi:hypothetical protein
MARAEGEFAGADLGDKRLNRRLMKLTERFADKPTASIPGACPDWNETQAVYRFFDQANNARRPLNWDTVLSPPLREVIRQIAMLGGVLGRKSDGEPSVKAH